jgi:Na+/melibiose symporter-like transporter
MAVSTRTRWWSVAMAIAALLSLAFYVTAVRSQGDVPQLWFAAVLIATAVGAAIVSPLRQIRVRRVVLVACTLLAASAGLISLFSVGPPLLATAALGIVALLNDSP